MYDKTKPHDMVSLHDLFCTACFVMATQPAVNNKSKTGYWPDTLPDWLSYSTDSIDNTIPKMVATTKQYTDYEKAIDLTLSANVNVGRHGYSYLKSITAHQQLLDAIMKKLCFCYYRHYNYFLPKCRYHNLPSVFLTYCIANV